MDSKANQKSNGSQHNQVKQDHTSQISPGTADKMKRPLGSVADLVAKKEPIVPSGAQIKKDKARQETDTKANNKSEDKKTRQPKTEDNQNQDSKAQDSKAQDSKAQDSKAKDKRPHDPQSQSESTDRKQNQSNSS